MKLHSDLSRPIEVVSFSSDIGDAVMQLTQLLSLFFLYCFFQEFPQILFCEKLLIISQRFFGIPLFRFYALADGIRKILSLRPRSVRRQRRQPACRWS